ncbi:hypothetical protein [Paenibacillus xylaniclasticus]|nr:MULTISPECIES: hypothetical protein [Paenibacillus]GFN32520.1 hypothetical protein PCURB6_27800 [Paenibacillus curdlanolyticus]
MSDKQADKTIEKIKDMLREDMTKEEVEKAGELFKSLAERNAKEKS